MSDKIKLISIVGARPQFVKLAPIVASMREHDCMDHRIVHTGQHYDDAMSRVFFDQLDLPRPDVNLGVGSGSHAVQTAEILVRLEEYLLQKTPDAIIVYGDTNSTLAAVMAASKIHVPIAHVEAGLRSYVRTMPEEINRIVSDHCGDRLYAPTPQSMQNLVNENLFARAMLSGDVMLDAVKRNIEIARRSSSVLEDMQLRVGEFGIVTVHRPANTLEEALLELMPRIEAIGSDFFPLLFPAHPRTLNALKSIDYNPPTGVLTIIDPLPYMDQILLIDSAAIVITDSGGIQKEAAFLGTSCFTLRSETEWTETVELGVNMLVGDRGWGLAEALENWMSNPVHFDENTVCGITKHFGDGNAASKITKDLADWLSLSNDKFLS